MNLIEQLGGYEEANTEYQKVKNLRDSKEVEIRDKRIAFDVGILRQDMLEYRRQHNIYEVGDWVYPLIRIIDEIEGVGRYICTEKGELVVVRDVRNKGAFCSHEHRLDNSFYMSFSEFRHATDAEIKAGRRL